MRYRAILGALLALGWAGSAEAQRSRGVELSATYCAIYAKAADGSETVYLSRAFLSRWGEMQNDSYWYAIDQKPDARMLNAFADEVTARLSVKAFDSGACITRPNRVLTFAMRDMYARRPGLPAIDMAWPASEAIQSQTMASVPVVPLSADAQSADLLEYVIQTWFWEADRDWPVVLAPALREKLGQRRAEQSAEIKRYGHATGFRLTDFGVAGRRTFRVTHENAVIDWTIGDDGKQISSLSWVAAPKE